MRVQLALEKERAPALDAALDDEGDRSDEADQHEPACEPDPARRLLVDAGTIARDGERGERDADGDGEQDRLAPHIRAPREPGTHSADEHTHRVGAVRERLETPPGFALDAPDVRVDRNVDQARADPACRQPEHERGQRGRKAGQRCRHGEDRAADRDRAGAESVDRAGRDEEHRGDREGADEEQRDTERALGRAGGDLHAREDGGPGAPEEPEHEEARERRAGAWKRVHPEIVAAAAATVTSGLQDAHASSHQCRPASRSAVTRRPSTHVAATCSGV